MDHTTDREKTNVPLSPKARAFIEGLREDTGVPKVEALTRILEFVAEFDHKAIMAILHRDADAKRELARLALLDMAGLSTDDLPMAAENLSVEDSAKLIQALTVRMLTAYRAEVAVGKIDRRKGKRD